MRVIDALAKCLSLALVFSFLTALACCHAPSQSIASTQASTDSERDGLIGNVKAVLTEDVVLVEEGGQWLEGQQSSSTAIYDLAGKRTLQTPFRASLPGGYAITQHESLFDPAQKGRQIEEKISGPETIRAVRWLKTYDNKGNLIEKTWLNASGAPVKKQIISYDFDARGNWIKRSIKMESEQTGLAPQATEASYRRIVYFDSPTGASGSSQPEIVPGAMQWKNAPAATQEALDRGQALFMQRCAACHGENGKSQTEFATVMPTRPADLTTARIAALTEGEIYSLVNGGLPSRGMPAFKGRINDEAQWQIALYVRRLSNNQIQAEANPMAKASPASKPASSPEAERRYMLVGKIISIERELQQVVVEHDEVKGYMEAMTMPFPLKDDAVLSKLKKGDRIQATLVVGIGFWRLENVIIK